MREINPWGDRKEAVNKFLDNNQLLSVIRGHEAQLDGYKMHKWNGNEQFPAVITIFSAPNYCDAYKNKGAVIKFSVRLRITLVLFVGQHTQHPAVCLHTTPVSAAELHGPVRVVDPVPLREGLGNALPHLSVEEEVGGAGAGEARGGDQGAVERAEKYVSTIGKKRIESEILRNKVRSISRMIKMFKVLRKENEDILKLKGLCPDNKLPKGVLFQGSSAIKDALQQFGDVRKMDIVNEKRPEA